MISRLGVGLGLAMLALAAAGGSAWSATNTVTPGSATACITPAHPCQTVPVDIARTDTTGLRLFHVTFQLSANLQLCSTPSASLTEGTYLANANPNTTFFITSNGGGSYTVDGTINGSPCGATAPSGNLFDISVAGTSVSGTGTVTITALTLRDCSNNTLASSIGDPASVTVDLAPVTVAPVADPQTVVQNSTLTITPGATLSACATGPTTWSVSPALPGGASINPADGVITWTPSCGQVGTFGPFTYTATAASGETGTSNAFSIVVTHLAGTVTVAAIADPQTVTENSTLTVTPSAVTTPCVGSPLTWSVSPALPAGATLDGSKGEIQWTPGCGTAGSYGPFTLTASAPTGETGSSNAFAITVSHQAGTVTVAAIADPQTVVENSTLTIVPSASTTACATGPFTWTVSPALPAGATLDGSTGEIQWTPACGTAGGYGPFTLTATAATGEAGSSNGFSITVTHLVGSVTVAAISDPQSVVENSPLTITPGATTTPCAGTLTWSVTPALPGGATFNPGTGEIAWTPACGEAGTYGPFTLTATAATGEAGSSNAFAIVVSHLAGTVAVAAISDPQSVVEQSTLTVTPSATTTPCVSGGLTWSVAPSLPGGATFNPGTGEIQWTPACGEAGTYGPFTLTATAGTGEAGSSNAFSIVVTHLVGTVTVAAVADPQNVVENSPLVVTPGASTTPCVGGPLVWSVAPALPGGATLDPGTGQIAWTPACGQAGSYGPFTLTATAPTGEVGSSNAFSITVSHLAGTVTVAAIPSPQTVSEGVLLTVTPSAGTTPCAGTLTWSVSPTLPAGAQLDPGTGVITWTPDCNASTGGSAGTYGPFTLTATASTGETGSSDPFSIHVNDAPIAVAAPSAVSATQVLTGNPVGAQVTGITVHFGAVAGATSYQVYRAPFGQYPEYDDNGGAAPTAPTAWPPTAPWTLTGVTTDGGVDTPPTRDDWYYVVYAANSCGDVSVASSSTGGTLNYHLGDVSNNATPGTGDDLVDAADVSLLGAHYGISLAANDPYDYLDVGPTTTNYVDGRPITDKLVNFEDLVLFAINFGEVSTAARTRAPLAANATPATPAATDALALEAPAAVAPGDDVIATITASGTGRVQAVSVALTWNPAVVEPVGQAAGDFLQASGGLLLSAKKGAFDVALLGHDAALVGEGTLATMQFKVLAAGDPGIRFASVDARDTRNQKVELGQTVTVSEALPTVTTLLPVAPNPVRDLATLAFALAQRGPVDVRIYAANGRLVRNLLHATKEAGNYSLAWDGRDDRGRAVAGGVYFVHLTAGQAQFTRRLTRLQ